MKKKQLLEVVFSICLVFVLLFFHSMALCAETPKTLRIGYLAGLTGFASESERIYKDGAVLAKEWINNKGGIKIKGQKYLIDIIPEDHKCTADGAVSAMNKLIIDEKLKFICGGIMPFTNSAAAMVSEPAGVLRVVGYNCAMPEELSSKTPYTFLIENSSIESIILGLTYLAEVHPKIKTIAVLIPDDGSIRYLEPIFIKFGKKYGISIKGDVIGWRLDTVDFTPYALKAIKRKADAIIMQNGWPGYVGGILKAARENGYEDLIMCFNHHQIEDILQVAGKEASTNFIMPGITPSYPKLPPMLKNLVGLARDKYGHDRLYLLANGFNSVWSLSQAIEAAQSLDPDAVRETWEKMETMETVYGTGIMGGQESYGVRHTLTHPLLIQGLMNGQVTYGKWIDKVVSP